MKTVIIIMDGNIIMCILSQHSTQHPCPDEKDSIVMIPDERRGGGEGRREERENEERVNEEELKEKKGD